jgi:hypothetical protein
MAYEVGQTVYLRSGGFLRREQYYKARVTAVTPSGRAKVAKIQADGSLASYQYTFMRDGREFGNSGSAGGIRLVDEAEYAKGSLRQEAAERRRSASEAAYKLSNDITKEKVGKGELLIAVDQLRHLINKF